MDMTQMHIANVEKNRKLIEDAYEYIWKNPESGYREWKTHAYLAEKFEALGYTLHTAGNIPGFYADLDTGRPGPTVALFGELDALIVPTHPACDPETGCVHACGHCNQTAALLGVAAALKEPGALDNMSGRIRLIAVPAEELIELGYREELRRKGVIRYFGGKVEFMYRGYLDGVDLGFMIHSTEENKKHFGSISGGSNGCMVKKNTFHGVSAHAGGSPHKGINALYAANLALNAANALRETFRDSDHVRFHPIITKGGSVVNAIPDEVVVESYVRAASLETIVSVNDKINRAMAAAAASVGASMTIEDRPGYCPRHSDPLFAEVIRDAMEEVLDEVGYHMERWGTGCSDAGDMSAVMPMLHPYISGCSGNGHGSDYYVTDVDTACVDAAKVEVVGLEHLLRNGAENAKKIVANYKPVFATKADYFKCVDGIYQDVEAVCYQEDGNVLLKLHEDRA